MKIIETKVYQFAELSDEAKQKAIEKLYDLNVDYDWWDCTYEDAKQIGLLLNGFDIDRGSYCTGDFKHGALDCAEAILKEHGETCETHKTATTFLKERTELISKYSDSIDITLVTENNEYEFEEDESELAKEFLNFLLQDYLSMLRENYEYYTSKEAIIETIEANEYDFTEGGELF